MGEGVVGRGVGRREIKRREKREKRKEGSEEGLGRARSFTFHDTDFLQNPS
jgi:hypothetical protein